RAWSLLGAWHLDADLRSSSERTSNPHRSTPALHTMAHRSGQPLPVPGDVVGVESGAAVADERAHELVIDLHVHVCGLDPGVLRDVDQRLAHRPEDRVLLLADRRVAADDDLAHAQLVSVLDV